MKNRLKKWWRKLLFKLSKGVWEETFTDIMDEALKKDLIGEGQMLDLIELYKKR